MSARTLYILILLLYNSIACMGQDSSQLLRLTMADGLPSNSIYSLLQDRNGYLWVTTDNGMAKYDGYTFRLFNNTEGLPLEMFGMFEDAHRRLWIDYYGYALGYVRDNKIKFINYNFSNDRILGFRAIVRKGRVFFEADTALVEIDSNDQPIVYTKQKPRARLFIHPEPDKFLQIDGAKLNECRIVDGKLQCRAICTVPKEIQTAQIIQRNVTDSGFLGHTPGANFLHFFNIYTCKYKPLQIADLGGGRDEGVLLFYAIDTTVHVVTNKAVYLLDLNLRLIATKREPNSIPGLSQVSYFIKDSLANEWYATTADGLLMSPGTTPIYKPNSQMSALARSVNVGTTPYGASYWWSSKQKRLFAVTPDLSIKFTASFPNADVQAVLEYGDELIIAFTQGVFNGVYTYDPGSDKLNFFSAGRYAINYAHRSRVPDKEDFGYSNKAVHSLFNLHPYKPGVFFATHRGSGINKIIRTKDSLIIHQYQLDRYPNMTYDSLHRKYWLYNKERLLLFDPETARNVTMPIAQLRKLNINSISQIQFDRHHNMYILTDKLICRFNTRTFRLSYIRANVDLSNVFMDVHDNMLFIAGNFGLGYAIISETQQVSAFAIFQNIKKHYYSRVYDMVVNSADNIILSTDKAVYTFNIHQLLVANGAKNTGRGFMRLVVSYPEQRAIRATDTIYLQQETGKLTLDLINFYGSGRRQYFYRIEGNNEWQTTEAGEIFVGEIKPERYYKVQCYVRDDIWRSRTYSFYIYQLPHWYQTQTWKAIFWVAGILLLATVVLIIVLLTRNIVAKSNEKRQLLTELELRAIHAQINPHFIFNTLGSALYFISKRKMDDAYLHVNKFSRLLRSYLNSSRNRYITLSEELEMLKNYIELQQIRFENKFDYEISVENKIAADSVQIPSLLLQPLVENAINHGLFHLPEEKKGMLLIRFYQGSSSDEMICEIEDNGVGRRKAREIRRSSDVQYESYGTKLTEELINIFKRYEKMNIYLEYIDKPQPQSGTIVKLTIRNLKYVT